MDSISNSTDCSDEDNTWCYIPETILLEIYQYLRLEELAATRQVCIRWNEIAHDDMLWKALFYRDFHVDPEIDKPPGAGSWYSEYRRLYEEVPVVLTESLQKHTNQVLHVSFSNDGKFFATASKDGHIVVWDASEYPCRMAQSRDMSLLSWRHPQHSQFNPADTLLLVSGIHFGSPHNTSGEIAVLSLHRGLELQCRVVNKPYDVFGCWVGNERLLSGELRWLAQLTSLTTLWLNRASQEPQSERVSVRTPLYRIYNAAASSVRSVLVAHNKTRATLLRYREEAPLDSEARMPVSNDSYRILNSKRYYAALTRTEPAATASEENESTSEAGSAGAASSEGTGEGAEAAGDGDGEGEGEEASSADSTDSSADEIIDKKLLIYTSGSSTYIPHQVSFKYIERERFPRHMSRGPSLAERLARRAGPDPEPDRQPPDWANYDSVKHMFDAPDYVLDLRAYIIGMTLTPDHKFLYVNVRCWPGGALPAAPLQPPPVSSRVQLRVVALDTLELVGGHAPHSAHPEQLDLYQHTADCYFIFLDTNDNYVASGGVDRSAVVWDRQYGVALAKLQHADVVNALAFRPTRPTQPTSHTSATSPHLNPMLVTVSDDHSIRVWRSAFEARELRVLQRTAIMGWGGRMGRGGGCEGGHSERYHRRRPCALCD